MVCSLFSPDSGWLTQGNFLLWHHGECCHSQLDPPSLPRGEFPHLLRPHHGRWAGTGLAGTQGGFAGLPSLLSVPLPVTLHRSSLVASGWGCVTNLCVHIPRAGLVGQPRGGCWRSCTPNKSLSEPPQPRLVSRLSLFCRHFMSWAHWKRRPLEIIILIHSYNNFSMQWFTQCSPTLSHSGLVFNFKNFLCFNRFLTLFRDTSEGKQLKSKY